LWSARDRVAEWGKPEMPAHEWLRYYANRWVGIVEDSWLADHPAAWANCEGDATIPDDADVVVAVDMALRRDSVAVLTCWRRPDGKVAVQARIWAAPTDGKIDHLDVLDHIRDLARQYTVTEVCYDPRFSRSRPGCSRTRATTWSSCPSRSSGWRRPAGTRCR
jgi:hypothetical protein